MNEVKNWMRLVIFDLDEGIREMSRNVMELRRRHRQDRIDFLLANMDLELFPERFLVAVLIATAGCAKDLKQRDDFKNRVHARMVSNSGSEAYANEQVRGL